MVFKKFNPGCPCDCCACRPIIDNKIGFEAGLITDVVEAGPPYTYIENIFSGPWTEDDLWSCAALFIGPSAECRGITLPRAFWKDIKCYIECGGRVYLAGEYDGCFSGWTDANSFCSYVGSTMRLVPIACDCACDSAWIGTLNTSVPMLATVSAIRHACTSFVSGGTWLAKINGGAGSSWTNPPACDASLDPFIAMEKIGEGYFMVAGDSNLTGGCGYDNDNLWRAFIENDPVDMLP